VSSDSKSKRIKNIKLFFPAFMRYVFLIAFSYTLLYPFIYIIVNSLKGAIDYYDPSVVWIPKQMTFSNFELAIKTMDFWNALGSTFFNEIVSAFLEIASCAVAAYGLARFNFKGKFIFKAMMILSILVPTVMIIIPSYVNFRYMDFMGILKLIGSLFNSEIRPSIINTPFVFWLPSLLGVGLKGGLFIYIYSQFFKGLPKEFEEAAWLDGAGPWKTFLRVIIPASSNSIITVALFAIVWHWNDYYLAQMYLSSNFPVSVQLANITSNSSFVSQTGLGEILFGPMIMAGSFLCVIPLVIFYIIMQKRFIASVATSGIVG